MRFPSVRFTTLWRTVVVGLAAGGILLVLLRKPAALSQAEAIRTAEQFVAVNGYTDLPPDRSRLVPEPVVLSSSLDEELELRRDTLERQADGATGGQDGWLVFFRYRHGSNEYRRAV